MNVKIINCVKGESQIYYSVMSSSSVSGWGKGGSTSHVLNTFQWIAYLDSWESAKRKNFKFEMRNCFFDFLKLLRWIVLSLNGKIYKRTVYCISATGGYGNYITLVDEIDMISKFWHEIRYDFKILVHKIRTFT